MPIQLPIVNSKARAFFGVFIYLIFSVAMIFMILDAESEVQPVREWLGEPRSFLWPIYLMMVGAWIVVYMLFFKIEGRRQWYFFSAFGLSGFLCVALSHSFWWSGLAALAVMMAILLIGQLYPARNTDRGQV